MSDIQITFQDLALGAKNVKLVTFMGQLDETNVDHEAKKIYQVITEMPVPVIFLDFSGLEYMNSKSIGYVTDWFTQATAKGGSISIIGPKPNILDILKVVGITQIITVYSSLEEAKTAIGNAPAPAAPAPAPSASAAAVPEAAPATPTTPEAAPATPVAPVPSAEAPAAPIAPATPEATPATPPITPSAETPAQQAPTPTPVSTETAQ